MKNPRVGLLEEWNKERGFGFLTNEEGNVRLFLHISELAGGISPPRPGDRITFFLSKDQQGRPQAVGAVNMRRTHHLKRVHWLFLLLLLALPTASLFFGSFPMKSWWIVGLYVIASTTTYSFYSRDKENAVSGNSRISELRLHVLELIGGWPGAFIAQHKFRHKCTKSAYQFMFRVIVVGHQLFAIDFLREGEISHTSWQLICMLSQS